MTTPDPNEEARKALPMPFEGANSVSTDEIPQEWVDAACREFEMPLSGTVQERFAVALAAVLPRIEQRVIDRLAREAGEGDLGEDLCDAFAHHSMPLWERAQITDAVHAVAARWVACGVAAERARWTWNPGDIYTDAEGRKWKCVAPERTTGEGT